MVFKIPPWKSPRWVAFVSKMSSERRVCGGGAVGKVISIGGGSSCGRVRDRCQSTAIVVGIGNGVPILIGGRQDTTSVGAVIDRPQPQEVHVRHRTVPCLMSYMSYKLLFERDNRTVPLSPCLNADDPHLCNAKDAIRYNLLYNSTNRPSTRALVQSHTQYRVDRFD